MGFATAQRFVSSAKSFLPDVSDAACERFVAALEVQPISAVSDSGRLGAYAILERRLVELGYAKRVGKNIDFVLPWTKARFLSDPLAQYTVLAKSTRAYYDALRSGQLKKPADMKLAGALVLLHRGGRGALEAWPKLFEHTRALYEAAQGAF